MKMKLLRGCLIGTVWQEAGSIIDAEPKQAEAMTRTGAAVPAPAAAAPAAHHPPPPVEAAVIPPKGERAVTPRQGGAGK